MLELEARLKSYQGKDYDDTPLVKSDEILHSIVKQFPKRSKENLEYLEQQSSSIQTMMAERDYSMGEYYESKGENLAATFHYSKLKDRMDGSPVSDQINERIAALEDKPARPVQPAQWLVNMFPDPDRPKPVIVAGNNEPIFKR